MPELTEVLNNPAAEAEKHEAAADNSATDSDSGDSVPELEDAGAGAAQTQVGA